jgi:hypothetical protein
MPEVKCEVCKKVFHVPPSRDKTARFCSMECKRNGVVRKPYKIQKTCQTCGKDFHVWPSRHKAGGGIYCSNECAIRNPGSAKTHYWKGSNRLPVSVGEMTKMYCDDGMTSNEIARHFGMSSGGVRNYLMRAGVTLRTNKEAQDLRAQQGKSTMDNNGHWKGGVNHSHGYRNIYCPDHPRASKRYVREHILVWERHNGVSLPQGYDVHHLNGIRDDNRIENLCAMPHNEHGKIHSKEIYKRRIHELEVVVANLKKELENYTLSD